MKQVLPWVDALSWVVGSPTCWFAALGVVTTWVYLIAPHGI